MREAFVRVLEGEIRNPGAFSVQTLRVLGTISTATAEKFRRAASVCMSRESHDARIPALGGQLGTNCLEDVGLSFDVLTQLTENGLLHPDYACWMPYGRIHDDSDGTYPAGCRGSHAETMGLARRLPRWALQVKGVDADARVGLGRGQPAGELKVVAPRAPCASSPRGSGPGAASVPGRCSQLQALGRRSDGRPRPDRVRVSGHRDT